MELTRRSILLGSVTIVVGGAGCLSNRNAPDIRVWNSTSGKVTYDISISHLPQDEIFFSRTDTLSPDESKEYQNPITEQGTYRLEMSVKRGVSDTYEFEEDGGGSSPDTDGISVVIAENSLNFAKFIY